MRHITLQMTSINCNFLGLNAIKLAGKKKKFGRKHGGIAVFVHESITKGVSKIPTKGSDLIILKLDRMFFNLMEDTYLFFAYCSPANSSYTQRTDNDPFSEIEENISNLGTNAQILLLGDLNARTGEDNSDLFLPDSYNTDIVATYPRGNRDPVKNQYGGSLTSLCKSVPPRIYNGRKLGDTVGNFTCHKWNGQSAVDYCLASPGTNI